MKAFVKSYCTISRLDSFDQGIVSSVNEISEDVVHPQYKEVIPPAMIRRMSSVIRMGVGAAFRCRGEEELDGIIVGSGLGCLENTEKFLDQFILREEGILAPTAFIQSTHNTIAGQIGLMLKANCYNSTYTQRGMSFENALIDACSLAMDSKNPVLVGGVDEKTPLMHELGDRANIDLSNLGQGSSFFLVSGNEIGAKAEISAVRMIGSNPQMIIDQIEDFLKEEGLEDPDRILLGFSLLEGESFEVFDGIPVESYSKICGNYMANSGFGLQYGTELIENGQSERILIVNNFADQDYGLIYLKKP